MSLFTKISGQHARIICGEIELSNEKANANVGKRMSKNQM
jgi:hypothetical protein